MASSKANFFIMTTSRNSRRTKTSVNGAIVSCAFVRRVNNGGGGGCQHSIEPLPFIDSCNAACFFVWAFVAASYEENNVDMNVDGC